jgi:glycosyltransferase involved in cell wall biosynthesis
MKITLAIPCIPKHLYRLHELVQTLKVQTVLPSEIVISISEFDANKTQILQRQLQAYNEHVPIRVFFFTKVAYAGENRNNCLEHANGDVITFCDADDVMHPRRIEIIEDTFTNIPDLEVLFHSYTRQDKLPACEKTPRIVTLPELMERNEKYFTKAVEKRYLRAGFPVTNGHISIRNTVKERYNPNTRRAEDAEYNSRILEIFSKGKKPHFSIVAVDHILVHYREHLSSR